MYCRYNVCTKYVTIFFVFSCIRLPFYFCNICSNTISIRKWNISRQYVSHEFFILTSLHLLYQMVRKNWAFFSKKGQIVFLLYVLNFLCTIEKSLRPSVAAVVDPGVLLRIVQSANRSVIFKGLFSNLKNVKCLRIECEMARF